MDKCENLKELRWEIDKDIIQKGNKIYSPELCCIVSRVENIKERNIRNDFNREHNNKEIIQFDLSFNYMKTFNSLIEALQSIKPESKDTSSISRVCSGKIKTCYGYYWKYKSEFEDIKMARKSLIK